MRSDTGEVVALDTLANLREIGSPVLEVPDAAPDAMERALRPEESDRIPSILGKIIARWVAETDLGMIKRIQISGITSENFRDISAGLAETEKISAVWPRDFDAQGISVIDVETRLDSIALAQEVTKASGNRLAIDRSTENFLLFTKK